MEAVFGKSARTALRGGRIAICVPTAIQIFNDCYLSPQGFLISPQGFLISPQGFLISPQGFLISPQRFLISPQRVPLSPHRESIREVSRTPGYTHKIRFATRSYPAANAHHRTQVTFGLVLPCRKTHLATYSKHGKGLSLRVDDIGRRRPLTRPPPGRQLPVVSAFSASEG